MPSTERLTILLNKPSWTDEDRAWLLSLLESGNSLVLQRMLREEFDFHVEMNQPFDRDRAIVMLDNLHQRIGNNRQVTGKTTSFRWKPMLAAASVIALIAISIYFFYPRRVEVPLGETKGKPELPADVAPGGNKAVLILADGSSVVLDDAAKGNLAKQGNVQVLKTADGELTYQAGAGESNETLFNTVSTPRGGQYHLVLPDGTGVWLNSASSLRFPVKFAGKERNVFLTGEGYFEVTGNKEFPFKVSVDGQSEVLVTGTRFNINAYTDEQGIHTTLLEGKVAVKALISKQLKAIGPGEQIRQSWSGDLKLNPNPDLEEVMAWKNGKFDFGDGMEFSAIMRQLSRWYDVEFIYEAPVSDHIGGSVPRDSHLSTVLKKLEETGVVRFTIEGKTVKVTPR